MALTENFTDATDMASVHAGHHNAVGNMLNNPPYPKLYNFSYYDQRIINGGATSNITISASQAYIVPTYFPAAVTIDRIGANFGTAGATGAFVRFALYPLATGSNLPASAPTYDFGTIATDTAGVKQISFTEVTVTSGWKYIVMCGSTIAAGTLVGGLGQPILLTATSTAPQNPPAYLRYPCGDGALPTMPNSLTSFTLVSTGNAVPLLYYRVGTVL